MSRKTIITAEEAAARIQRILQKYDHDMPLTAYWKIGGIVGVFRACRTKRKPRSSRQPEQNTSSLQKRPTPLASLAKRAVVSESSLSDFHLLHRAWSKDAIEKATAAGVKWRFMRPILPLAKRAEGLLTPIAGQDQAKRDAQAAELDKGRKRFLNLVKCEIRLKDFDIELKAWKKKHEYLWSNKRRKRWSSQALERALRRCRAAYTALEQAAAIRGVTMDRAKLQHAKKALDKAESRIKMLL